MVNWFIKSFSGTRKGIEDVVVSMMPQVVMVATGVVTSVLMARGLGPKGMGDYALILSVSGLAASLSDLGIGQTAIRFASRAATNNDTENQLAILRWAFRLRMLLVLIVTVIVYVCAPFLSKNIWQDSCLSPLVKLSLLTGIFSAIAAIPTIYFQSLKRFKMNAIVTVGQTMVSFFGVLIIALLNHWTVGRVITVSVVATGLGAFVFIMLVPKLSFVKLQEFKLQFGHVVSSFLRAPKVNYSSSESMDSAGVNGFAFYMLISSVVVAITVRADILLMGYFVDKTQIGLYSVASRFTLPLTIVLNALNTALWPRASSLTSITKTKELISKTFRLSALVASAGLIYALFIPVAMPFIFGAIYKDGILLAQVLCIRYCMAILTCPIGVIGYSFGMVRAYWWINILQLIAVVLIDVFMLPRIGPLGAALALIANEIIGFSLIVTIIWRRMIMLKNAVVN